jgi:Kef-type K+ transport system membrane component KefB
MSNSTSSNVTSTTTFLNGGPVFNSPVSLFLVQVIFILVLSRLLGFAIKWIKEPLVIAEIIAGIIIGPSVMGQIPGFSNIFFPSSSIPLLNIIAQIGLILFMFVVGMEIDLDLLRAKIKPAILVAICGIAVPFAFTLPLIWILGSSDFTTVSDLGIFYLFLGVVSSISALPVLARILSEFKLFTTPLGVFTLTAASIDDLIAWPLLALSVVLVGATSALSILWLLLAAGVNVALLVFVVRPLFRSIARKIKHSETLPQFAIFLLMVTLFALAFVSEIIGSFASRPLIKKSGRELVDVRGKVTCCLIGCEFVLGITALIGAFAVGMVYVLHFF